jgi:D-alanyl-D-alanine carboxypeptidase
MVALLLTAGAEPAAAARFASILLDGRTGQVLEESNADAITYPASLTKIMTLYMVFEALEKGKLRADQRFPVSQHAAAQAPSKLDLKAGETVAVQDLILALITKSANDAAVVIAEGMAGSEFEFARRMTKRARELGMSRTTFRNASGLPNPHQQTTARDMATLGRAMWRDHPRRYRYFATDEFVWKGQIHHNHNGLLGRYDGVDGIKTGFINASGFNLVASAERNGRRLIGVVMGGTTARGRDARMASLLDAGFDKSTARAPRGTQYARAQAASPQAASPGAAERSSGGFLIPSADAATLEAPMANAATLALDTGDDQTIIVSGAGAHIAALAAPVAKPSAAVPPAATLPAEGQWGIQVGAFHAPDPARQAADEGLRDVGKLFAGAKPVVLAIDRPRGKKVYRARLMGLSEAQARQACAMLAKKKKTCMTVTPAEAMKQVAQFN